MGLALLMCVGCPASNSSTDGSVSDTGPSDDVPTTDAPDADSGPLGSCDEMMFEDITIPMRDGKSLAAFVRHATDSSCALPTILIQTPYNKENARSTYFETEGRPLFASTAYNFVVVDWRGAFASADAATNPMPPKGQDGYDTVEWIADQSWSNGKIATWGVSALCKVQYYTALYHPPHLVSAVPAFCELNDTFTQWYPGGVYRREYADFVESLFSAIFPGFMLGTEAHPTHDVFWDYVEGLYDPGDIRIPILVVAGYYDLHPNKSFRLFDALQTETNEEVRDAHRLLIGPWTHFALGGEQIGGNEPDEQEQMYLDHERVIEESSLLWFDAKLRDMENDSVSWSPVRYYDNGTDSFVGSDAWPAVTNETSLYLTDEHQLAVAPSSGSATIPWDPSDPSPTTGGSAISPCYPYAAETNSCEGSTRIYHGPRDQAPVIERDDAAVFTTEALESDTHIAGAVYAEFDVSTTGEDADIAIRLTDVDADGTHMLIGEGIRRLRMRDGYNSRDDVEPGEHYTMQVELTSEFGYTFAAGHRIGLIVSGGNYPRFERNPGTGDDFHSEASPAVAVDNTIYFGEHTRLVLPVE